MAIDARVSHVSRNDDGGYTLWLAARDSRVAPAGQSRMTIAGPAMVRPKEGWELWGNDGSVMLGQVEIYKRDGMTGLRECATTPQAVREYRHG